MCPVSAPTMLTAPLDVILATLTVMPHSLYSRVTHIRDPSHRHCGALVVEAAKEALSTGWRKRACHGTCRDTATTQHPITRAKVSCIHGVRTTDYSTLSCGTSSCMLRQYTHAHTHTHARARTHTRTHTHTHTHTPSLPRRPTLIRLVPSYDHLSTPSRSSCQIDSCDI
jgi:hypothetical protein